MYLLRERNKGRHFNDNEVINKSHIFYSVDINGIKGKVLLTLKQFAIVYGENVMIKNEGKNWEQDIINNKESRKERRKKLNENN